MPSTAHLLTLLDLQKQLGLFLPFLNSSGSQPGLHFQITCKAFKALMLSALLTNSIRIYGEGASHVYVSKLQGRMKNPCIRLELHKHYNLCENPVGILLKGRV